jgi:hypothetical protein|tara:strand:- start:2079 stop:2381 length:303 start_codon:yes stop_codon:yes gene_type:complete
MDIGFDLGGDNVVPSTKKVVEPTNFVDGYNPPDSAGGSDNTGRINDPVPPDTTSWTSDDYIPNIELSEKAKQSFIDNLPEDKKPLAYLGIGVLAYYLFFS